MAKLFFRYSCMGSGKSTSLLQVAHNYETVGLNTLLIKPQFDTRDEGVISSRLGVRKQVDILLKESDDVYGVIKRKLVDYGRKVSCILVDEANFLTAKQARGLWRVATELDIVVIAYGLRVDYMGEGFEASKELLTLAHEIEELKTVDKTGKKCTMHLRSVDGEYVFEGDPTIVGDIKGDTKYESCTSSKWLQEYNAHLMEKIADEIDHRGGMC